ncbi:SHOCT domain-containing protein [Vibrio sp. S4M6]|uniref:SHOCT domain-containing protein n=1 Tax=Vibrio sinus TaxID=2946865 RepID=UPI002029EAC4|nr:SHOCT domain-containing protein [Vibrio sinus]MCL9782069.1 SHOCT domain-containing protein [Vibrio sinus]
MSIFYDYNWTMPIAMILFWGLLIYLIFSKPQTIAVEHKESPLDIAKRRLANGEINSAEFEQIRDKIR